jgi:hypothetical protein
MFISKKRWQALTKRIADLEVQVQSQRISDIQAGTIDASHISVSSVAVGLKSPLCAR